MLKKASNFVLGRSNPSTYEKSTLQGSRSLRPRLGQGASRRAGVGRVRTLAFLSILLQSR